MTDVVSNLVSALSSLTSEFSDDPEKLHLAVALVFSSIFRAYGIDVVVVGGQAATHWLRVDGSVDVDFVADNFAGVRDALLAAGFVATDAPFRLVHHAPSPDASVLIELVGEAVEVAGVRPGVDSIITVQPTDIENPIVRALMMGDALVIDPGLVFLNYAEASHPESIWHDFGDDGGLAHDRAEALLALYAPYITERLRRLDGQDLLTERLLGIVTDEFQIDLS